VFCVFGDSVATPPLSAGCLSGVTRNLVVEWCGVEERDISVVELADADEVFLTSTTRDVQGLAELDDREFPAEQPITAKITQTWREREPLDVDP
jgi:branched-chain amino acid aminotransferase